MAEDRTIARPYAQAAFERAREQGDLRHWSEMLALAAAVVSAPEMQALLGSSRLTRSRLADLVIEVCADGLDAEGRNLIRLLAEYRRLGLLPEIASQYEALRAEAERSIEAEVLSARPLEPAQQERLAAALGKRLGREVRLQVKVDPTLLGGAIVRAGDLVIDGSVRGRLHKLAARMGL